MAGPGVYGYLAAVMGFGQRIDDVDGVIVDRGEHLVAVGDQFRSQGDREGSRRAGGGFSRKRFTQSGPGIEPAVD